MSLTIPIVKFSPHKELPELEKFLLRPAFDPKAEETARRVLADIRATGDRAVQKYTKEFNGLQLPVAKFAVPREEVLAASAEVDLVFKRSAAEIFTRIVRFGKAGMRKDWSMASPKGGVLGERFTPLARVGAYIPGGAAPLVSTALMSLSLAKVAGVPEIVACTPCDKQGKVNPYLLHALEVAGATEIYRIGGIQAIGAMAYGTNTIRKVQKIVGPGGPYVTAAKKLVYGDVDLDMVAGPSEIAVLADETAVPAHVAADLISQLEHGTGHEKALLVTPYMSMASKVLAEMQRQIESLSRRAAIEVAAAAGAMFVVADTLDTGMDLINRFAPEHLEIMTKEPRRWLQKVKNAGAIFVGPWTPESAGDFVAGPSHVLPTGGTAAFFSGLSVDSFRKRSSVIAFTRADLLETLPLIEIMGQVEGLDGHARAGKIRFTPPS
ncbi:MAG TPA: histidinol dehydrogenase [Kiritimatiellia bacterium]|jgi:histidinol dehydrogenase|nr:histidinol dehydrogenase [Kiritimatiellia bacterium]HOE00002.1 histidinol dehydrogenase [Kiritimatiellia bacterium]HOE36883.1 histidinol dehydrogenase [Kiritimatiellia bacterium]HOR74878.1 histidinol dehydrogenase [Kiritimatiellia bacterium]HOU58801.1 histidinol dehydrogenase [Kiritimatiellia bacterium]